MKKERKRKKEERRREEKEEEEEKEKEEEEQLENYPPGLGGAKSPHFSKNKIYNLETHFFPPLLLSVRGSIIYIYIYEGEQSISTKYTVRQAIQVAALFLTFFPPGFFLCWRNVLLRHGGGRRCLK